MRRTVIFFILLSIAFSGVACAGEWRVVPIRLDFDKRTRSGAVSVANDGKDPLTVSVEADEWLQDSTGKDNYAKSSDLIFFPQVLTIGPKEERVIRVGIKVPAITEEKTYRLFITENPGARKSQSTEVAIAIRFGVPVFVEPLQKTSQGEIRSLTLGQGKLHFVVTNTGNVHFRIKAVKVSGLDAGNQPVFSKDLSAWYLLAGATQPYDFEIPPDSCPKLHSLDVEVTSDDLPAPINQQIDVDQASCLRK